MATAKIGMLSCLASGVGWIVALLTVLLGVLPFGLEGIVSNPTIDRVTTFTVPLFFVGVSTAFLAAVGGIVFGALALARPSPGASPNPARLGLLGGILLLPPLALAGIVGAGMAWVSMNVSYGAH